MNTSIEDVNAIVIEAAVKKEEGEAAAAAVTDAQLADAELIEVSDDEASNEVIDHPPDDGNVVLIRPAPPFPRRRDWPGPRD